jgi:hypothetical protein
MTEGLSPRELRARDADVLQIWVPFDASVDVTEASTDCGLAYVTRRQNRLKL